MADKIGFEDVSSSNIGGLGYDAHKRILAVRFKNGDIWHYGSVPMELAHECVTALSVGQFFNANIKGRFPAEKMTGPCERCGAKGWIGDVCVDCGCGSYRGAVKHYVWIEEAAAKRRDGLRAVCGDMVRPGDVVKDSDRVTCPACKAAVDEFERGEL